MFLQLNRGGNYGYESTSWAAFEGICSWRGLFSLIFLSRYRLSHPCKQNSFFPQWIGRMLLLVVQTVLVIYFLIQSYTFICIFAKKLSYHRKQKVLNRHYQITPGAYADLVIVNGDLLQDISILSGQGEALDLIMKDGVIYKNRLCQRLIEIFQVDRAY